MKRWARGIVVAILVLGGITGGYWKFQAGGVYASGDEAPDPDTKKAAGNGPIAGVKTVPIRKGKITEHLFTYGTVIAAPGALQTVSIPFESQILGIMVNDGQKVAKGDGLLRIQPSPDTLLQLDQARNAYRLEQESFQQAQRRYDLKLATNEQLIQGKRALGQARLRLESLKKRGIDGERRIDAAIGGLVKKVFVQEGSIVPAGNPLMEIVEQNRLEVLLGVEPEDISRVRPGQTVSITRVNAPASPEIMGGIRQVSYAVNPSTRLVDVFVSLASPAGFLLGEFITSKIAISARTGLIVQRSAVLFKDGRHVLFTVKDGRAVEHVVRIDGENADEYGIEGQDLQPGEQVAVVGNYELTNGMQVATEPR